MNELISEYVSIENKLSPENLYCDGERPKSLARKIGKQLRDRQVAIIRLLGRVPTDEEIRECV